MMARRLTMKEYQESDFTDVKLAGYARVNVMLRRYRWSNGLGWLWWDGRRWVPVSEVVVTEAVRDWLEREFDDACKRLKTGQADSAEIKRWLRTLNKGKISAVVGLARGMLGVLTDAADFDRHPDLLNVTNGVVDLRTGELRPHDPALLFTKITHANYRPGATHPDWTTALGAIPPDVLDWVQTRYGQAITGHPPTDDLLIVQVGAGENGKTTVMGAISRALGDYAVLVPDRVILGNPSDHPTELMELRGARLALIEETPEARQLQVARLKKIIGTPQITARLIRQDSVTFNATHTLILNTNYRPQVAEVDHGTWRRLALVKFPYRYGQVSSSDPDVRPVDRLLRDRLRDVPAAQEAVLAWLVEGAVKWYAAGRDAPPPDRVVRDTRAWRAEADLVLRFCDEELIFDPAAHVIGSDLSAACSRWLGARGNQAWSEKLFDARFGDHSEVRAHGVEKRQIRAGQTGTELNRPVEPGMPVMPVPARYRAWLGVRFRTTQDDHRDAEDNPAAAEPRRPALTEAAR